MDVFMPKDVCTLLAMTLLHFVWQGFLIFAGAAALSACTSAPRIRYSICVVALVLMAICPALNGINLSILSDTTNVVHQFDATTDSTSTPHLVDQSAMQNTVTQSEPYPSQSVKIEGSPRNRGWGWGPWTYGITTAYLFGVATMLLRLVSGIRDGHRLRHHSTIPVDDQLIAILRQQSKKLGFAFQPLLAYCDAVTVPTVMGLLKPIILVPLALTSHLTTSQIEAILIHELAHLRRHDHWINLAQGLIEAELFFHPAVWWLSQRIRIEREHCCDDLVVAAGTAPLDYTKLLLQIAELCSEKKQRRKILGFQLLALGQPSLLRRRISRLLDTTTAAGFRMERVWRLAGFVVASLGLVSALPIGQHHEVQAVQSIDRRETNETSTPTETQQPAPDDNPKPNPPMAVASAVLTTNDNSATTTDARDEIQQRTPQDSNRSQAPPPQSSPVAENDSLTNLIETAIQVTYERRLVATRHSPWQIFHGLKALGLNWTLRKEFGSDERIPIIDWVTSNPAFQGEAVWQVTNDGARAHPYSIKFFFEGHPGQFLAALAAANAPIDLQLMATQADGKEKIVTVGDVINDLKQNLDERAEWSWILQALAHYESVDCSWTDKQGRHRNIEQLVRRELNTPIVGAPSLGCPRLMSLAIAHNKYRAQYHNDQSEPNQPWDLVRSKLDDYISQSKYLQHPSGQFSADGYKRRAVSHDLNERIFATGSQLEWLAIALPDDRIQEKWVNRAATALAQDLIDNKTKEISAEPLFGALHALKILHERRSRLVSTPK